jgi:hypothetical protein
MTPRLYRQRELIARETARLLVGMIALFGLTRIGAAADSRDNNTSASERLGSNSSGDSFFRLTSQHRARFDTGVESKEDSKRFLESYKPIARGNSEYDSKDRLNPLTLYHW